MGTDGPASGPSRLFAELKRRNVVRVALVYLGTAWLIAQFGTLLGETFETPHWVMRMVILLLALGFPVALGFAWMFELTPEGLKPTGEVDPQRSITHHTGRKLDRIIMIVLALVVVGLVVDRVIRTPGSEPPRSATAAGSQASVAVLPFVNMSNDAANEPFADGLSEEVLNMLAGIQGLKVAGRTSSFYFKGKSEKPAVIAATLGVSYLLEGSVRWAGQKVRVTAQLIDASTGFHVWSQPFDRELNDVFAVQEEIARSVAQALQVTLLPADVAHLAKRGTQDAEAHQLYLVARGRMRDRDLASLRAAKALFEDAIKRDPSYANAHAGLADVYFLLVTNHGEEIERGVELGEAAANRALELDPDSSEAHVSRANYEQRRFEIHGDPRELERALADFKRGVELDPNNAQAYHWYGNAMQNKGLDEALALYERAVELDPLMIQAQLTVADVYAYRGQTDKALDHVKGVIDRYPDFANAYYALAFLEWRSGRLVTARSLFRKAYELSGDPTAALFVMVSSLQLDDRATADVWRARGLASGLNKATADAWLLSMERKYAESLDAFIPLVERYPDEDYVIRTGAQVALIAGQPQRAAEWMLQVRPELAGSEATVSLLNCEAAIILASAWQRTHRQQDAQRLLQRAAAWIDGPAAPRWPEMRIARAEVHALLGEKKQALDLLDRAFDEGYRGVLGAIISGYAYRGEDSPLFASIKSEPRFVAWYERLHADNVRALAEAKEIGPGEPTPASQPTG